jgi:AraC-like DNA-binding protein
MQVHNEILRNIARSCEAFGVKENEVYVQAGVDEKSISVQEGMQDWRLGIKIWESALKCTNYRYISLNFGKNITFSVLGWIAPLTSSSPDLHAAWKSFTDFFPLLGNMFEYHLRKEANGFVTVVYKPAPLWVELNPLTAALAAEHAMSLTLSLSSFLTGKNIKPAKVAFTHDVPAKDRNHYTTLFGPTHFNQEENYLSFDSETAALPVISSNSMVYENMLHLCSNKLKEIKSNVGIVEKVKLVLNQKQSFYSLKIEEVAAMLNMSARTLQRKLKEEGSTYQALLEEFQVGLASQMLRNQKVQVKEVAFMLGFSSLQNFSRAFKRKTGKSPSVIRG